MPHCPRFGEFPQVELYMDQVLSVLEAAAAPFCPELKPQERLLTPAMINNYVKQRLLPPPRKKRYRPEQLAALLLICLFKNLLPMGDIKELLAACFAPEGELQPAAYDYFCEVLEQSFDEPGGFCAPGNEEPPAAAAISPRQARLIRQAAAAYTQKTQLQRALHQQ